MIKILIEYKIKSIDRWDIKIYEIKKVYFSNILIYIKTNNKIE